MKKIILATVAARALAACQKIEQEATIVEEVPVDEAAAANSLEMPEQPQEPK